MGDPDETCEFGEHDWVWFADDEDGYYICDICDDETDEV